MLFFLTFLFFHPDPDKEKNAKKNKINLKRAGYNDSFWTIFLV